MRTTPTVAFALLLATSLPVAAAPPQEGRQSAVPPAVSIEARLAAAKLAETRGDLAAAEQELRGALAAAGASERARVDAELQALLARQGRGHAAPAPAGDPVQRLIATLEQGSDKLPEVKAAIEQLEALGALAVPPLLDALPRLGAFGLTNGLRVLFGRDDARIAAALLRRLDGADPATTEAITSRLAWMARAVAVPVATELARREVSVAARFAAFQALVKHGAEEGLLRELALQLAKDPAAQAWLVNSLGDVRAPWQVESLQALTAAADVEVRVAAILHWLRAPALGEDDALRQLATLPEPSRAYAASMLAHEHRDWIRVALLGLASVPPTDFQNSWAADVEWWRAPQLAAAPLFAKIEGRFAAVNAQRMFPQFVKMIDAGWSLPPELDEPFQHLVSLAGDTQRFSTLVRALPADAEDRALAMQQRFGESDRRSLAYAATAAERPWHRLVARALAEVDRGEVVPTLWIARDWSGAPPEAVDALARFVARFGIAVDGSRRDWAGELIRAYRSTPSLPSSVIMPFVAAGDPAAFTALAARDPEAALAHARAARSMDLLTYPELDALLRRHGTESDVPLAVRLLERIGSQVPDSRGVQALLDQHGKGRVDVIGLGRLNDDGGAAPWRVLAAKRAAAHADVAQLPELLASLPRLHWDVIRALGNAIEPQIRAEHAPLVADALGRMLERPVGEWQEAFVLLRWIAAAKDARALPAVRRVLVHERVDGFGGLGEAAVQAALAIAGSDRTAVVAELLASPRASVVAAALLQPELATDARARAVAKEAILRVGGALPDMDADAVFAKLAPADRIAFAGELLAAPGFGRVARVVAEAALRAYGRSGEGAVATLALGLSHGDVEVRKRAVVELGTRFTRDAAPFLLEALKDRDPEVRKAAQQALDELAQYLDAKDQWEKRLK